MGFGPGEITDSFGLDGGSREGSFWVYSAMGKRFSEFNLNDTLRLSHHQVKQEEGFFMAISLAWSSDSTVMSRLANDRHRFVEFHIDNGTRVGDYGLWTDILARKDLSDYMMAELHQGWLKGNQEKDAYVSAGMFRDRLEILNKNNGEIISVDGPTNFIPKFDIVSSTTQSTAIIVDINEPLAYLDVYITDDNIYGLYSGRTERQLQEGDLHATEIYVFDLEGNIP